MESQCPPYVVRQFPPCEVRQSPPYVVKQYPLCVVRHYPPYVMRQCSTCDETIPTRYGETMPIPCVVRKCPPSVVGQCLFHEVTQRKCPFLVRQRPLLIIIDLEDWTACLPEKQRRSSALGTHFFQFSEFGLGFLQPKRG